jgi:undecaprenyl-diphosphatase
VKIIVAILLFLLTLFVFVYIADEIVLEHETGFDQAIMGAISNYHSDTLTSVMKIFTFFGSQFFLLPAYVILIGYYLIKKRTRLAINIGAIGLTSSAVLFSLKYAFKRNRPLDPLIQHVAGFSFPSGHSFSSFTFYGLIAYILWQTNISKSWKVLSTVFLFLLASLVAFSRVYLQVHFPSDVVAGFCLSMVWLILSFWVISKVEPRLKIKST